MSESYKDKKEEIIEKTPLIDSWKKKIERFFAYIGFVRSKKMTDEGKWVSEFLKRKPEELKNLFDGKPTLTVYIDPSQKNMRGISVYELIRKYWLQVSDEMCSELVEEKGYLVCVIKNVIIAVVQVDGWKRHEKREDEKEGRVEFTGKPLTKPLDHPSLMYTLKYSEDDFFWYKPPRGELSIV